MCPLGDVQSFVHGNNQGIPQDFVQLYDTEFRKILGNFARDMKVTEIQKTDGIPWTPYSSWW